MDGHRKLISTIEAFDHWEQPWTFYESLLYSPNLDIEAHEHLLNIWVAVTDSAIWLASENLAHGCLLADVRLATDFPWLTDEARRQLTKAASYQWL